MLRCACVVGLGLIGGSIARALTEKCGVPHIIGIDPDPAARNAALSEGAVTLALPAPGPEIRDAQVIFLCGPVSAIPALLTEVLRHASPGAVVTDVASVKGPVIAAVEAVSEDFVFVGGHPMAGSEKTGFKASLPHLFENAYYVLTPCRRSTDEAVALLEALVTKMGAIPLLLDAAEHDRAAAAISHLPHVAAAALVELLGIESPVCRRLAAGGFRDITRIASSSPSMWRDICLTNRDALLELLSLYGESLDRFRRALASKDGDAIFRFYANARTLRDSLSSRQSMLPRLFDLRMDALDRPGFIGSVADLLGNAGVNIKNLRIENSREYEGGIMTVSLEDADSLRRAGALLKQAGYSLHDDEEEAK